MITHGIAFSASCTRISRIFTNIRLLTLERHCVHAANKYYSTRAETKVYETPIENIRNFSIIAHVDHGKSTLADRLLEMTGAIKSNSGKQVLDKLQVEKERGITVKAQTASLNYKYNGAEYLLNLIDTPGHVDFSAEVQRSLVPCQGVILVVDANDGVQAQTVANYYLAIKMGLTVIPVINKIDLKNANPKKVIKQLELLFNISEKDVLKVSAKFGTGVDKLLDAIVERIEPPVATRDNPFRALIFDSWYDRYKGAISLVYISEGSLSVGQHIVSVQSQKCYEVKELAILRPDEESVTSLCAGQIGCMSCGMKTSKEAFVGDTIHLKGQTVQPLLGIDPPKPLVFSGIYPIEQSHFVALQAAIEKLTLNDNGVSVTMESSAALGRGWRVGFLGLLHMEVFTQRLEQEYGAEPIVTAPGVTYKAKVSGKKSIAKYGGEEFFFNNPIEFPETGKGVEFYEPMACVTIITPEEYIGEIMTLCIERRGEELESKDIGNNRIMAQYSMPLNEIIVDFHDALKSITSGYASFDYEDQGYELTNIVKLCIALNGNIVEELSTIVHTTRALVKAKHLSEKLLTIIPRQQFEIVIQAKVGSTILVRKNIKPYRKDVTAKLYGGDVTRRMKLLAKQQEGKKKMKMIGNIELPRETFVKVLQR